MNKLGSKRCGLILVFLLFALSFSQLAAEPPENSRNATHSAMISEIIDEAEGLIKTGNLTGIAFGYITDEESEIICLGTTNSEKKQPVDRQTIFEMGSITKVFTVLLAHQQLAKDGLDLETPVSKLFQAETIAPDLFKNGVTCLNLALHNSGLPRLPANMQPADQLQPYADYTAQHLYEFLATHTLEIKPGTRYSYSNLGSGLLGHLMEVYRQKSFFSLLHDHILKPLEMSDTFIDLPEALHSRMAHGYYHDDKDGLTPVPAWKFGVLAGCGALKTTPDDLLKFLRANLSPDSSPLGNLLRESHQIRFDCGGNNLKMCLGWHCFDQNEVRFIWHNGGTYGFSSFMGFSPEKRFGFFILANSWSLAGKIDRLAFGKILPAFLKNLK
ncbi:MAG: hypothetical protein CVV41_22920 [Candidatus Riflebacteria bacterium HGW-Riflebacteria-1]|jgi:CubicO group peptidase (beta-lactamase class C family)|nr:MAG: hypothetical protein CVV41_22920 [Candidatus Riflebacteria bacterium HGW-Riflebacteria-1]